MRDINTLLKNPFAKPGVFILSLLPMIWLVYAAVFDHLGANPAEALVRSTGDWTLRMLCVVLAITPVRILAGLSGLATYRRMVGLFVYFYACLHLLSYAWFDMGFDIQDIASDIGKRPFILVGFTAIISLTPLAITSFNRAIRWLGGKRWQQLHRLVYLVAILAVIHFFWMRAGKNNFTEVVIYAFVLGSLLAWRVARHFKYRLTLSR
jgi:sulfoxide reductase heme-binding subunit YedZ